MSWIDWFEGHLTTVGRIVTAAAPAVALLAITFFGLIAYLVRIRWFGRFHDEEMDGRGIGGLTTARGRHFFAWLMRPIWRSLVVLRVPPDALTTLSVCLALGGGVAISAGRFALGGWLYVTAGALDFLDGRVARESGRVTRGGAALDSVLDRYCESAVLVGLAWYYRHSWVLVVCLFALTGSLFVPYVRARGEALGAKMRDVGLFQRAERIVVLGLTVALSPIPEAILVPDNPAPPHRLAILGLVLIAIASHATAIQRLQHLLRFLDDAPDSRPIWRAPGALLVLAINLVDFAVMHQLVETGTLHPIAATAVGSAVGFLVAGVASGIFWGRGSGGNSMSGAQRVMRFLFIACTSVGLYVGGVAVIQLHAGTDFHLAWAITRVVVFVTWIYPLWRDGSAQPLVRRPLEGST